MKFWEYLVICSFIEKGELIGCVNGLSVNNGGIDKWLRDLLKFVGFDKGNLVWGMLSLGCF